MKKTILILTMATLMTTLAIGQEKSSDDQAIRNIVTTLEKGWNTKSGELFSSVFADVHDYIVINGFYFSQFTRQNNANAHQFLFNTKYKTSSLLLKVDKLQYFRPDLAQITVLGGGYEGTTPPVDPTAIMTILTEKKDGVWKIISFHNHSLAESFAEKNPPMPFKVMYANWYKN